MPSPANGRTSRPCAAALEASSAVRSPVASHTKLPWASGTSQPWPRSAVEHAARARRPRPAPAPAARPRRPSDASAAVCARSLTPNGVDAVRTAAATTRVGQREADPQPGEPVRLGERAQQHDVRVLGEQAQPVGGLRVGDELDVRLVDHHEHAARAPRPGAPTSSSWCTAGPVGLFGVHTSSTRVRSVTAAAIAGRSWRAPAASGTWTQLGALEADQDRVRLEGPPGADHLVARLAERLEHVAEHGDRAGAGHHAGGRHAVPLGDRADQLVGEHLRVAVDPCRGLGDHLAHRFQRLERVLVRRQLVRPRVGGPGAGHVGGQGRDGGAGAHGVVGHAVSMPASRVARGSLAS